MLDVAAGNGNASLSCSRGPSSRSRPLDEIDGKQLESELLDLAESLNTATDGTMRVPSEYLEVVAVAAEIGADG